MTMYSRKVPLKVKIYNSITLNPTLGQISGDGYSFLYNAIFEFSIALHILIFLNKGLPSSLFPLASLCY